MPLELVIVPEAELEIAEAYVWYEGRRAGLGEEFLSSVEACLEATVTIYAVFHASRDPDKWRRRNP